MSDVTEIQRAAPGSFLSRVFVTRISRLDPDGSIRIGPDRALGLAIPWPYWRVATFGPYWRLNAGHYRCVLRGRVQGRHPEGLALTLDVVAQNRLPIAWGEFTAADLEAGRAVVDFAVTPELAAESGVDVPFEFKLFHYGTGIFTIDGMDLLSVAAADAAPPTRRWQIGRTLFPTPLGRRQGDSIVARGSAIAGPFAVAYRRLLPAGRFLLRFKADVAAVKRSFDPVLVVDIGPRHGLNVASVDFTAAELGRELSSVTFRVPRRYAFDSGESVFFKFRFATLGNGAVSISDLDLIWETDGEEPVQAVSRRLLGHAGRGRLPRSPQGDLSLPADERSFRLDLGAYSLKPGGYELLCEWADTPGAPIDPPPPLDLAATIRPSAADRGWRRTLSRGGAAAYHLPVTRSIDQAAATAAFRFEVAPGDVGKTQLALQIARAGGTVLRRLDLRSTGPDIDPDEIISTDMPSHPAVIGRSLINTVIVGNCQAENLCQGMLRSDLSQRLRLKYHFVNMQENLRDDGRADLKNCDVVLIQDISNWTDYPLRDAISERTQQIKFPCLWLASLWPFDGYNGPTDMFALESEGQNLAFTYLDGLLARLRNEIPDPEARFLAYKTLAVDGIIDIRRLHRYETRRLQAMDKTFDCDIGQYVLDRFQEKPLFHTTNHPTNELYLKVMGYMAARMELARPRMLFQRVPDDEKTQIPVHPKVGEILGMRWATETTTYAFRNRRITWETYVRAYIAHYG